MYDENCMTMNERLIKHVVVRMVKLRRDVDGGEAAMHFRQHTNYQIKRSSALFSQEATCGQPQSIIRMNLAQLQQ